MIWLGLPLVVLTVALLGWALTRLFASGAPFSSSTALASGCVALHVALQLLGLAGVPWHWLILPALSAAAVVAATLARARHGDARQPPRDVAPVGSGLGWGDAAAVAACLLITGLALAAMIDNPDFVYHWGAKGRKFALAGGLDLAFLGPPSGWHVHPDYPNLLPELFAVTARAQGSLAAPPLLAWSGVFFAGLLLAAREALASTAASRRRQQAGLAFVASTVAAVAIGATLAGAADWLMAWALVLALPALIDAAAPGAGYRLAVAAGLAASAKIEGVPLAVWLLAAFALASLSARAGGATRARLPASAGSLAAVALPSVLVVAPWLWIDLRHGLFLGSNSGAPSLDRLASAAPALLDQLTARSWHGATLALLLVPWLLAARRLRWAALVCVAQLAFYVWVYASAPVDTVSYVQWSFLRLLLHVLPAIWVLSAMLEWRRQSEDLQA